MADLKFSCPQCNQHIQCDVSYSGMQINCPSCQKAIVVPQAPQPASAPPAPVTPRADYEAPPPPPPPVSPPSLTTRQSTTVPASGRRFAGAPDPSGTPSPKPKSKALRNVLVITASVLVLAGLGAGGWIGFTKFKEHKAAQEAKKGNPAAQVPTPTAAAATGAQDILEKVRLAYKNLTSLSAAATSVTIMDTSQVTAGNLNRNTTANRRNTARRPASKPRPTTNTSEVSIKLARPDLYRLEGITKQQNSGMMISNTIAVWSAANTNYLFQATVISGQQSQSSKTYTTVPNRTTALSMGSQTGIVPQLFFDEAGDIIKSITNLGQTGDESVNGQDCFTLTAKVQGQKLKVWVNKSSYMISQLEITLGGTVSEEDITAALNTATNSNLTPEQIQQVRQSAAQMTQMRGSITVTYDYRETNQTYAADDFKYPVPRGVRLTPSPYAALAATTTTTTASAQSPSDKQRNACINNLRQIDAAKNQWALEKGKSNGTACTEADIKPYLTGGGLPKCPAGGKYTIGKVGEIPTCSIAGHALP